MKYLVGVLSVMVFLMPFGVESSSAEIMRWQVNGATREAIVQAPDTAATGEPLPLVLSFHGYGDNMENFQHTNVHVVWPEAVVVYFQGLERSVFRARQG